MKGECEDGKCDGDAGNGDYGVLRGGQGAVSANDPMWAYLRDFAPEKEEYVLQKIKKSHPSDHIYLGSKEDAFLIDLWERQNLTEVEIPSDLFFANTIPIEDVEVSINESDLPNGRVINFRVVVFDDYQSFVRKAVTDESGTGYLVGAIVFKILDETDTCFVPILVSHGRDALKYTGIGFFPGVRVVNKDTLFDDTKSLVIACMETWYGIQIALLHPAVKDVFQHAKTDAVQVKPGKPRKDKRRKVKYIKKHVLTIDTLESTSNSKEQRKINRKCLSWYVIGHWRKYKNGKTVFIMPYWKGVLRELKKNADDDERERTFDWSVSGEDA